MPALPHCLVRELAYLRRDKGELFLTLGILPLLCCLIWWIFSAGQPEKLPVALVDLDQTSSSRNLSRLSDATAGVSLQRHYLSDAAAAIDALRRREVYAVLVIPKGFETRVLSGRRVELPLQVNSQYSTYASTIERNLSGAVLTAAVGIGVQRLQLQGVYVDASTALAMPIQVTAAPLFNQGPNYEVFLAATLIPALFHILAMVLAVSAVGRELRDATAPDWLASAQGSLGQALVAKLLPYWLVLAVYGACYVLVFAQLAPHSYSGSGLWLWLSLVLMNSAAMALGCLLLALCRNFRMGLSLAGFYSAPAFAYSGQAFPLVAMPLAAQAWASMLPLTHWIKIYNQLGMAGAPLVAVLPPLLVLLAMLLGAGSLAYWLLQRSAFEPASWGAR